MTLQQALSNISAPKGFTSLVNSLITGDLSNIDTPDIKKLSNTEIADKVKELQQKLADCKSDSEYWSILSNITYCTTVILIKSAADLVGENNLPDVPPPELKTMLMVAIENLEQYGKNIYKQSIENHKNG